jgi:hypothetical protein
MLQFLCRMFFQLIGDIHEFRTFEKLRVDDVRNYGLVFPRQIVKSTLRNYPLFAVTKATSICSHKAELSDCGTKQRRVKATIAFDTELTRL